MSKIVAEASAIDLTRCHKGQIIFLPLDGSRKGRIKVETPYKETTQKIKIQIGDAVFEAEGPTSIVEQQFQAFIGLLSNLPEKAKPTENIVLDDIKENLPGPQPIHQAMLDRVFRDEGDFISLSARPTDAGDALLILLYGFDRIKNEPKVTGVTMMKAAKKSGVQIPRIDRYMNDNAEFVLTGGAKRGKRYSLNNRGIEYAEKVIRGLI